MKNEILVTGGAGFIGSHFIDYLLNHTASFVTNVDNLSHGSSLQNMAGFSGNKNYRFFQYTIFDRHSLSNVFDRTYDVIVHFAAESHVDRSIENREPFLETNIYGTFQILEAMLMKKAKKMIYVSTDEVYGTLEANGVPFTEQSLIQPNNPYAATKAAADLLVRSYFKTYGLPVITVRSSNNFGPRQHREKFIPKVITNALLDREIPIYGDGMQMRDWLYVEDHCRAIASVLEHGDIGEVYNIGGGHERTNLDVAKLILDYLDKDQKLLKHVEDRMGHDRRYAVNWGKIHRELGWKPKIAFYKGLVETIEWFKKYAHPLVER